VKIKFVKIPAGTFLMGSPASEVGRFPEEGLVHRVHVPAFRMSAYPITEAQFGRAKSSLPVTRVSWHDARAFCERIDGRLPTEAEWEYACRAGTTTRFYAGGNEADLDRAGWYDANSGGRVHPVGQKKPNVFGLYDMHGNVWEWCEDDWHGNYKCAPTDGNAWIDNPRGGARAVRGGSWFFDPPYCRSACRLGFDPDYRNDGIGFRVVVDSSSPRTS